jgi:hypothetical protein
MRCKVPLRQKKMKITHQTNMNDTPSPFIGQTSLARGIIIGLLVIVVVILLCALYIWGSMLGGPDTEPFVPPANNEPETPRADADIQILRTVSSSDELSAIESDLESTNLDSLDKELELIENDLKE